MIWSENGGVPSELPTVEQAKKRILDDVPNILETAFPEDELNELVDSDLPVYYSEILYQWSKMPSEFEQPLNSSLLTDEANIYTLMVIDLHAYYLDTYAKALEQVKAEKCNHVRTVCPRHRGGFDCTPFCDICEAEQEYCSVCDEDAEERAKKVLSEQEKEKN